MLPPQQNRSRKWNDEHVYVWQHYIDTLLPQQHMWRKLNCEHVYVSQHHIDMLRSHGNETVSTFMFDRSILICFDNNNICHEYETVNIISSCYTHTIICNGNETVKIFTFRNNILLHYTYTNICHGNKTVSMLTQGRNYYQLVGLPGNINKLDLRTHIHVCLCVCVFMCVCA